jgi:hypothetical protein
MAVAGTITVESSALTTDTKYKRILASLLLFP